MPGLKIGVGFLLFFSIPVICSMFFGYQSIGGYISPAILLFLTWLFYKQEGKDLEQLGLKINKKKIGYFFLGLILGIVFFVIFILVQSWYNKLEIRFNKNVSWTVVSMGVFFLLQGVFNEELIFRGYCFKRTVEKIGVVKANLIFAFLFIVWHWIALDAWGNYGLMIGLVTTGFGHFLFATALLRSKTLLLPIGLHLGNNWASHHLFAAGMGDIRAANKDTQAVFSFVNSDDHFSSLHVIGGYSISIFFFLACTWIIWKWTGKSNPGIINY